MPDIWEQYRAAFDRVSAYVVLKDGERVATVALKFPQDGAGRLYAYVHWIGIPMVRAFASGFGYDKRTAALAAVARKLSGGTAEMRRSVRDVAAFDAFRAALAKDDGHDWTHQLEAAGFTVLQAV